MAHRLFLIIFFICGFFSTDMAQSFQRTDKNAGFFVPNGAFQPAKKQEKLPSVQQMQYQGSQAPVIMEMEQEKLAKEQAEAEAEKKRLQKQKQQLEAEKKLMEIKQKRQLQVQKRAEQIKQKQQIEAQPAKNVAKEVPMPKIEAQPIQNQPTNIYEQIMAEYARDLQNISQGLPVNNPRLNNMLNEFNDEIHIVE